MIDGVKSFEVRKWDRPYRVGDTLSLKEYDPEKLDYTGRETDRKITYLLDMTYLPSDTIPHYAGYVAIGLSREEADTNKDTGQTQGEIAEHENLKPLTLGELRQMNGEPVWVDDWLEDFHGWELSANALDYFDDRDIEQYGSRWIAYRHKPPKEDKE